MTESTRSKGRTTGLLLVGGALLLALPLTATSAVRYVDVAAPEPVAAPVPVALPASVVAPAPVAPSLPAPAVRAVKLAALAPAAAAAPRVPGVILKDSDLSISGDSVWIDGKRKRWEELTPEERARVRAATAQARKTINEQIANLPKQLAEIERSRDMFRSGDFQRQMIDAREGVQRALAEMDAQAKILRATGQDPDKLKRDLQKSLEQIQQTNVEKITRESLESLDPEKIRSQIMSARTSLDEIEARLNQLERR
jgi:hypothetical protein